MRQFSADARLLDDFGHGYIVADSSRRPLVLNDAARRFLGMGDERDGWDSPLQPWMRLSRPPARGGCAKDPLDEVILGASSCGPELVAVEDSEGLPRVVQVSVRSGASDGRGDRFVKATMVGNLDNIDGNQVTPLFTAVFEEAPVAMGLAEVDATGAASITRVNRAYSKLLGFSVEELVGRGDDLIHPDDAHGVSAARRDLATGKLGRHVTEARILRADGNYLWGRMSRATVHDRPGHVRYVLVILEDITEQKKRESDLGRRASTDPLTGLLNRAGLMDILPARLADPSVGYVAVAMIDLDNFKTVNDQMGHVEGDRVLKDVARGLKASVRPSDAVARWGGDEFVVVAQVASEEEGNRLGRRVAKHVTDELEGINQTSLKASSKKCGSSVGVAVARPGDTPETIVERADHAMYTVKKQVPR